MYVHLPFIDDSIMNFNITPAPPGETAEGNANRELAASPDSVFLYLGENLGLSVAGSDVAHGRSHQLCPAVELNIILVVIQRSFKVKERK